METAPPELRAPLCQAACPPRAHRTRLRRARLPLHAPPAAQSSPTATSPLLLTAKGIQSVDRFQSLETLETVMNTLPVPQSLRQTGRRAKRRTRLQIRLVALPPPLRLPPVRTSAAGRVASRSWSPPASWIFLLQGPRRRSYCKRKPVTRDPSPPPLPRHLCLTGVATLWPPLLRTRCPPPPTAPKKRTLSWAPAPTDREMTLLPSPPLQVLCPEKAGSPAPFIQLPPLSSWLHNTCRAHRQGNLRAAQQQRAGNLVVKPFFFFLESEIEILFIPTTDFHIDLYTFTFTLIGENLNMSN